MKASGSIVSHEAGVIRRFSRLARASSHGASGGTVGQAARGRSALPAGEFSLRATRRAGSMRAVPHSSGPIPRITSTPNQALQRTVPRVTVAAVSSSVPSRPSGALSYVRCRFLRSTTQLPRRAPRSLSLGSLAVARTRPFCPAFFRKLVSSLMTDSIFHPFFVRSGRRFPVRSGASFVRCP